MCGCGRFLLLTRFKTETLAWLVDSSQAETETLKVKLLVLDILVFHVKTNSVAGALARREAGQNPS